MGGGSKASKGGVNDRGKKTTHGLAGGGGGGEDNKGEMKTPTREGRMKNRKSVGHEGHGW